MTINTTELELTVYKNIVPNYWDFSGRETNEDFFLFWFVSADIHVW